MTPIWLRASYRTVEIGTVSVFLLLGMVLFYESMRLGPGWGDSGPQPGFFPFVLTVLLVLGLLGVIYIDILRRPDNRPFFEVSQEVSDLLRVGIPILVAVALIRWIGMYVTAGLYLGFFMAWYGKFRWSSALAGGLIFSGALWLLLREGFNISMPMSVFYRSGTLPF
jgi:hypothetical protein